MAKLDNADLWIGTYHDDGGDHLVLLMSQCPVTVGDLLDHRPPNGEPVGPVVHGPFKLDQIAQNTPAGVPVNYTGQSQVGRKALARLMLAVLDSAGAPDNEERLATRAAEIARVFWMLVGRPPNEEELRDMVTESSIPTTRK